MDSEFLLKCIDDIRKENLLCDVTLVTEGFQIMAHKIVLAGASDYFKRMFCSEFAEAKASKIQLDFIQPSILTGIIEWIYGSKIQITFENAFSLLSIASMFFLSGLEHRIRVFLEENMTIDNCINCLIYARTENHRHLEKCALEMASEKFYKVIQTDEFKKLPKKIAASLKEELRPTYETKRVVLAVGGDDENTIWTSSECLVEGESRWSSLVPYSNSMRRALAPLPKPRMHAAYAGCGPCFFIFGGIIGFDTSPKNDTLMYSFLINTWTCRAPIPVEGIMNASATFMNERDLIYLTGGSHSNIPDVTGEVFSYNPSTDKWYSLPSLLTPRMDHATVAVHGRLYVLGGLDSNSLALKSCERYDSNLQQWLPCASMHRARTSFACAALGRFLWVIGGYYIDSGSKLTLGWCERYDTVEDIWLDSVQLLPSRWGCIAAGPFGSRRPRRDIIIAGGFNEFNLRQDTIQFNTASERPNPGPAMLYKRKHFAMAVLQIPFVMKEENI